LEVLAEKELLMGSIRDWKSIADGEIYPCKQSEGKKVVNEHFRIQSEEGIKKM